ncbi:MAG: endolytic transglycosylase MltG, partial [Candidatus Staskawiczbacteria bacterium]|nr:endolytic transglycosylase MltG [Candidatus Staskawiczbacteria bacterium]
VSGILWKRLDVGMPLQVDATINYITNKNDSGATIKDTKIDSLYNTYKYKGLPKGPISNPGMDSILAAIYPTKTKYWYYLSGFDGQTIFSETFAEHGQAVVKYLK